MHAAVYRITSLTQRVWKSPYNALSANGTAEPSDLSPSPWAVGQMTRVQRMYTNKFSTQTLPNVSKCHGVSQHTCKSNFILPPNAVAQLVEALDYKLKGCGFDSRWSHLNFSVFFLRGTDCFSIFEQYIPIQMEKLPHYHFSWTVAFQKLRFHVCEMHPLETKHRGGGGRVFL
jgi:hypothetical protein